MLALCDKFLPNKGKSVIHIWLPNPQAPLRVWQDTTQTWQTADNWQEIATLINLQTAKKNQLACLYFPSLHLLRLQPELTATQLKALGDSGRQYLFEEISIGSVEDLQIKSLPSTEQTTLYALHASDREAWLNSAQLAGVSIVALLPDFLLVPIIQDTANVVVFYQDTATQLLRFDTQLAQGMAVTHLPIQLSKLADIERLYLTGDVQHLSPDLPTQLDFLPLELQYSDSLPQPVVDPARHWLNFASIKRDTKVAPYAKVIMAVFVLALLAGLLVDGLRWYHYQKAQTQAQSLLKQQFEQWFPNEKYNTRLSMQRQLSGKLVNEQTSENNLMSVLGSIQPVLRQYQINAQQLNYQNNRLQLQLVAKDSDSLNKAVTAMNAQGVTAKLGNVSQNNAVANPPSANGSLGSPSTTPTANQTVAMVDISL